MTGTVTAKYRYDDFGKLKEIQKFNTAEETGKDKDSVLDVLGDLFGISNSKDQEQNQTQTPSYHEFFAYNAESYNPNTEMQYLRAGYYKPETANFLTEDSYLGDILKPLTLNRYNYCAGNPVNYKDPSGNSFNDIDEIENYKYIGFELLKSVVSDKVAKIIDIVETPDKIYRDIRDGINCALEEEIQKISESVEKAGTFVKSALIGGVLTSSVPGSTMPQYAKDYDSRLEIAGELYREYDAKSSAISGKYEEMREETVNSYLDSALFPVIFQGARETTKIAITMLEIHYAAELLAASFGPSLSALMNKISKFIKPKRLYQVVADCGGFGVNAIFEEEIAEEIVAEIAGVIAVEDSILATLLAADATGRARELLGGDENHNSLKDDANSAKNAGNADECPNAGKKYYGKLVKVSKPDPAADALAKRIGGESRVKFSGDPDGREFDVVSDEYIGQAKPALQKLDESLRRQMKATFEAAKETGRKVYYQFEGMPGQEVINKLYEYSKRYGIEIIIDTEPLGVTNK